MRVHSIATINLSNGENVVVEQSQIGVDETDKNVILNTKITEELSEINKNPVGKVAYNSLTLKIQSGDNSLTPENKNSPYYGYMNSTAIISIAVIDANGTVDMGTFYVEKWYSNISSEERKSITIMGSGYMKTISKMLMPPMQIKKNQKTESYVREVIEKLNKKLPDRYKIQVDDNLTFGDFNTLEYTDIEAETVGEAFETISQCTLTNIYIDRDNKLKTDYCFDDRVTDRKYTIGDCINAKSIKVGDGGLSDYAGVEVTYNNYIINNISSVAQLSNQSLQSGTTEFIGINSSSKIYKIIYVIVDSDSQDIIQVSGLEYDKRIIDISVNNLSDADVNANINIFGQTLNESQLSIERYTDDKHGTALQVTNNIILKAQINNFVNKLLKLIGLKSTVVQTTGWFDARLKLGDIVYLDAEKTVNTKGYYKIVSLEWDLSSDIFCSAKLVKLIS